LLAQKDSLMPALLAASAACSSLDCREAIAIVQLVILNTMLSLDRFFEQQGVDWLRGIDAQTNQQVQKLIAPGEKDISPDLQRIYSLQYSELAERLDILSETSSFFSPVHRPEKYLLTLDREIEKMGQKERKAWLEKLGETMKEMTRLEVKLGDNHYYYYYNDTYIHTLDYLAFRKNLPVILFVLTERRADFAAEDIKNAFKSSANNAVECISRFCSTIRDNLSPSSPEYSTFHLDTFANFTSRLCSITFLTEIEHHPDLMVDDDERRKLLKYLACLYLCCEPVMAFPDSRFEVPADLLFEKKIKKELGCKQVIEIDLGSVTRARVSNPVGQSTLVFLQIEDGGDWIEDYSATGARTELWVLAKRLKLLVDMSDENDEEKTIRVQRWSSCMAPVRTMLQYFYIRFDQYQTQAAAKISEAKDAGEFAIQTEKYFEIDDLLQNSRWWHTYMGYCWLNLKRVSFKIEELNRALFYDRIYNYYKVVRYTAAYCDGKPYADGTYTL
jgi:hypothetical protein